MLFNKRGRKLCQLVNAFHTQSNLQKFNDEKTEQLEDSGVSQHKGLKFNGSLNLGGIAIKLSILEEAGLSISQVFNNFKSTVIIDAEDQRLDLWLKNQIDKGLISSDNLKRLLITVQVKRDDATNQMKNLEQLGVRTVLVSGNDAYLKSHEKEKIASSCFADIIDKFDNIKYLGISSHLKQKIQDKINSSFEIENKDILELHGYQSLQSSNLWIYYTGAELSNRAKEYLKRRRYNGQIDVDDYIARSYLDLQKQSKNHKLFIFVDLKCSMQFINWISDLNKFIVN